MRKRKRARGRDARASGGQLLRNPKRLGDGKGFCVFCMRKENCRQAISRTPSYRYSSRGDMLELIVWKCLVGGRDATPRRGFIASHGTLGGRVGGAPLLNTVTLSCCGDSKQACGNATLRLKCRALLAFLRPWRIFLVFGS